MTIAGRTFTVSQDGVETSLLNGVLQSGSITGTSPLGTWVYYYVDLPSGATNLVLDLYNLSADADLYVRRGSNPLSPPTIVDLGILEQQMSNVVSAYPLLERGGWVSITILQGPFLTQ